MDDSKRTSISSLYGGEADDVPIFVSNVHSKKVYFLNSVDIHI